MGRPSNREEAAAFGEALTDALWAHRKRAAEVAREIGVSKQAMHNYTAGKRMPSPGTVSAIERAVGCAEGELSARANRAPGGE